MAGLLDDALGFLKTPEGVGLLSAAFGGASGARRGTPWNNIGRAGIAGLTGYAQAQDQQTQMAEKDQAKKLRDMQFAELQRKMATESALRDAARGAMLSPEQQSLAAFSASGQGGFNPPSADQYKPKFDTESFLSKAMAVDPIAGIDMQSKLAKEKPDRVVVPAGATVWEGGKAAYTSPFKEGSPSNLSKLISERDALPADSPARTAYNNAIRKESEIAKQIVPGFGHSAQKAPSGYRFTTDGELEPIKGGPADVKAQIQQQKEIDKAAGVDKQLDAIERNIDKIMTPEGKAKDGLKSYVGQIDQYWPEFAMSEGTAGAGSALKSLQEQMTMMNLAGAKTAVGQSFGSMQVKEWDKFMNLLTNVSRGVPDAEMESNLKFIRAFVKDKRDVLRTAIYGGTYGIGGGGGRSTGGKVGGGKELAAPQGVDPAIWGAMTEEERSLWSK